MEQITRDEMIGLLSVAACPAYCNNGVIVRDQLHGEIEQCQFCYEREHAITALKAAEPVGIVVDNCGKNFVNWRGETPWLDSAKPGTELFTLPCPPATELAPESWHEELETIAEILEADGDEWNCAARIRKMLTASPAPEHKEEWISVDERLPEPGITVMVCAPPQPGDYADDVRIGFDSICPESDGDYWLDHGEHYEHYSMVAKGGEGWAGPSVQAPYTHWMPLPKPPQQEETER